MGARARAPRRSRSLRSACRRGGDGRGPLARARGDSRERGGTGSGDHRLPARDRSRYSGDRPAPERHVRCEGKVVFAEKGGCGRARSGAPTRVSSSPPVPVAKGERLPRRRPQSPFRRKHCLCRLRRRDPRRLAGSRRGPYRDRRRRVRKAGARRPRFFRRPLPRRAPRRRGTPLAGERPVRRRDACLAAGLGLRLRALRATPRRGFRAGLPRRDRVRRERRDPRRLPIRLRNGPRRSRPDTRDGSLGRRLVRRVLSRPRRDGVRLGRGLRARDRRLPEIRHSGRRRARAPVALAHERAARRTARRAREAPFGGRQGRRRRRGDTRPHGRRDPREAPGVARRPRRALENSHGAGTRCRCVSGSRS